MKQKKATNFGQLEEEVFVDKPEIVKAYEGYRLANRHRTIAAPDVRGLGINRDKKKTFA